MIGKDQAYRHYRTLELHSDASVSEIREAYYRLALVHHPDRNPGDPQAEARFKQIQLAYDVLSKRYVLTEPRQFNPFPLLTPDLPQGAFRWQWVAIATTTVVLLVALWGTTTFSRLSGWKTLATKVPATEENGLSQSNTNNRFADEVQDAVSPGVATGVKLSRVGSKDQMFTEIDLKSFCNAVSATARDALGDLLDGILGARMPEVDSLEGSMRGGSGSSPDFQLRLSIDEEIRRLTELNAPSHVPQTLLDGALGGYRYSGPGSTAALDLPKSTSSWEASNEQSDYWNKPLDYNRPSAAAGVNKGYGWIFPGKSQPKAPGNATAPHAESVNKLHDYVPTSNWDQSSPSWQPPLAPLSTQAAGFANGPDADGLTISNLSSPSSAHRVTSGLARPKDVPQVEPKMLKAPWESSRLPQLTARGASTWQKPQTAWTVSDGQMFQHSISRVERLSPLPPIPSTQTSTTQSLAGDGLSAYAFPEKSSVVTGDKFDSIPVQRASSLANQGTARGGWSGDRITPVRYERPAWTPTSTNLKSRNNGLPQLKTRSIYPRDLPNDFQPNLLNDRFATPQNTPEAAGPWQQLTPQW